MSDFQFDFSAYFGLRSEKMDKIRWYWRDRRRQSITPDYLWASWASWASILCGSQWTKHHMVADLRWPESVAGIQYLRIHHLVEKRIHNEDQFGHRCLIIHAWQIIKSSNVGRNFSSNELRWRARALTQCAMDFIVFTFRGARTNIYCVVHTPNAAIIDIYIYIFIDMIIAMPPQLR